MESRNLQADIPEPAPVIMAVRPLTERAILQVERYYVAFRGSRRLAPCREDAALMYAPHGLWDFGVHWSDPSWRVA